MSEPPDRGRGLTRVPPPVLACLGLAVAGAAIVAGVVITTGRAGSTGGSAAGTATRTTTATTPPASNPTPGQTSSVVATRPPSRSVPLTTLRETVPAGIGSTQGRVSATIGGHSYPRAIGLTCAGPGAAAASWYAWPVPTGATRFTTTVGLDDREPNAVASSLTATFADQSHRAIRVVTVSVGHPAQVAFSTAQLRGLTVSCQQLGRATDYPAVLAQAGFTQPLGRS